ncbi:PAS-domain containing protein [Hoeflea sp. G2-23]|uniref:PAS-domain containing protein n=1 Tax=Hoeflea algicola TaxID=2983763 RepID=A0ABT3Z6V7_9HYPH|nr:adenylate/guanylate cyclase domain-containing protein [Hoeflea algicola]MCY0147036.1 PAS-domain containing protein [Hoeflea algicola]
MSSRPISFLRSVRGRLIIAFLGISFLSLVAGGAGLFSLDRVNGALSRIADERVPQALALVEVSRQAERILNAAPALLVVTSEASRLEVSKNVRVEVEKLRTRLLEAATGAEIHEQSQESVAGLVEKLDRNLLELDALVTQRIKLTDTRAELSRKLATVNNGALRLIAPAERQLGAQISSWNRSGAPGADTINPEQGKIARTIIGILPQQDLATKIAAVRAALSNIAITQSVEEVEVLTFGLNTALAELRSANDEMPQQLKRRLVRLFAAFVELSEGENGLPEIRKQELIAIESGEELLEANAALSNLLSNRIDFLVKNAKDEIAVARASATDIQKLSFNILVAVGALSLVSSILVVWLYVGRVLIRRLTALSNSMLSIADGDLEAPLPKPGTDDEIGRMGEALIVFRDTAVEVKKSNLEEMETARRRLNDAIENSSEGFAFYDPEGHLVICNSRYSAILFPNGEFEVSPGTKFETVTRESAKTGLISDAVEREDEWVEEQLAWHLSPGEPRLQHNSNGQWILISERKTGDGGTVAIYSDITDLKARENELSEKSTALEQLSKQLAKYLSPQIYDSIFSGKQEVKLVSQRKRLTVFFSDLVGFTETTERLESEDLTRLLNQYLTEMSNIAIAHGATIDKFIGDAIVIFFGDPETLGVKEDAAQCVKMAIAMRKRMKELERTWQDSGLEKPLQCRIGINTGLCTVGNFGSDDRMDYTIIGGGVNLAARLEGACAPGEILISYETYAHVKDLIDCEERDQIKVKGISAPVTTFQVGDLFANLDADVRPIRASQPNFSLDLNITRLSHEEQAKVLDILKDATQRIEQASTKTNQRLLISD